MSALPHPGGVTSGYPLCASVLPLSNRDDTMPAQWFGRSSIRTSAEKGLVPGLAPALPPTGRASPAELGAYQLLSGLSFILLNVSLSSSLISPDGLPLPTDGTTWLPASGPGVQVALVPAGSKPVCVPQVRVMGEVRVWAAQLDQCPPLTAPP